MSLKCTMILGDCIDVIGDLPLRSQDMAFCDLPYGVTAAKAWDTQIDLPRLWAALFKGCKGNAPLIFSAIFRFAYTLMTSNLRHFRYDLVYHKERFAGHLNANRMPLRRHENLLVFYKELPVYNPQKIAAQPQHIRKHGEIPGASSSLYFRERRKKYCNTVWQETGSRHPGSVVFVRHEWAKRVHPTQKPVALLDWLIRTYTNPDDNVLDPTSGSGTTACAGLLAGRNVTCIEKDAGYFKASVARVKKVIADNKLDVTLEVRR